MIPTQQFANRGTADSTLFQSRNRETYDSNWQVGLPP